VSFSDYSEYYPTSLLWEFGNGSSDTGSNVTHAFGTGMFDVSLIASNSFGSDTIIKTIFIDSVDSDFILPDDTIDIDVHHLYINTSYGSNAWEWDFGDGGNSTDEFPYHTYTSPGIYQISLLATNTSTGCLDSIIKTIVVLSPNATGITPDVLSVIKVAPNPTTGMIFIQYGLESNSNLYLIIKDVLGQDVFAKEIEVNSSGYDEIDLTKYPKGIYFVNLSKLNSSNQDGLNEINTYKLIVE
jgi:PKD repeat protein